MSVSAQETVFSHVGNGATVTFPYGCQVPQAADLQVYLDDVLVTAGFTVSGIGALTGGAVTFDVPPANGVQVRLERVIALERVTDYQQNGDFLARVVNPDFNRLWMALQQQATALKRALLVPRSEPSGAGPLPSAASRANNLLAFDEEGNPIAVAPAAQSATALQALMATIAGTSLIGFIQAGVDAVKGWLQDRLRLSVELWDFLSDDQRADVLSGAGTIDCTDELQAAHDHGATLYSTANGYGRGGAVVLLPRGAIKFTTLTRRNGVSMKGKGRYKSLLLMSQNGGTGVKCAAAATQASADNVYWLEDAGYSLIPNPGMAFTAATTLWDMTGFSRNVWRNIALGFRGNVTAVAVKNATPAGNGGPAQWYNDFYSVFVEGDGTGGVGWDLGDTLATKEQITTWTWFGGRTSGNSGVGMRINSATGCNLYGHVFEGLDDELIIGSAAGTRGTQHVNLYGCYFEGSVRGYTIYPNAIATRLDGCFATGVTNNDAGTRTILLDDGQIKFPVANSAGSFQLQQQDSAVKPEINTASVPGLRLKNSANNWVDIENGAASGSGTDFFRITDIVGHTLFKTGNAVAQLYASQLSIGNQSAVSVFINAGSPEGAIAAAVGSVCMRTNGGAVTSFYVKESGTGNTGWIAK